MSWALIKRKDKFKENLIPLILGPYLLTSFFLQSGLFTDRSRDLRETMENISRLDLIQDQIIKVDKSGINSSQSQSKIIRIALMTPNLGEGIENLNSLDSSELAWTREFNEKKDGDISYKIIYKDKNLEPWQLIRKK